MSTATLARPAWRLRPATEQDRQTIAELQAQSLRQAWGVRGDDPVLEGLIRQQSAWRENAYAHAHGRAGCQVLVSDAPAQLLGRLWTKATADGLHIVDLWIAPAHRRQGWARCCLQGLQARSTRVTLRVDRENEAARRLYAGLGFKTLGPAEPDLLMAWSPSPSPQQEAFP